MARPGTLMLLRMLTSPFLCWDPPLLPGALAYLHNHGVTHGDLTCNNVLLTSSTKDARHWIAQV